MKRQVLPIDSHLPSILAALESDNCLIIEAPPGTGKTTRAAPALLELSSIRRRDSQVVLIQPRRVAARAAAVRIAAETATAVGQRIGYQVRFDSRVSAETRLIAMTPGILLRMLQSDAVLQSIDAVVLDEFHERSLECDLLLGMLRRLQTELRPELRLVLMSATLDSDALQSYLHQPPVLRVEANTFPVAVHHSRFTSRVVGGRIQAPSRWIVEQVPSSVVAAARDNVGDILVFLPGVGEIMQVQRALQSEADKQGWLLQTLYGDMPPQDQDAVFSRSEARRIILATNVAETSLTIESIRTVVDSGWARVSRVDPASGLNKLVLEPISQASAAQRAGRAGRTAPGTCYRLWDEVTARSRPAYLEPEVSRVDLGGAGLQLLCWGESDLLGFPWLTQPPPRALEQALESLRVIGALEVYESSSARVSELGRLMNEYPVQPRLARLLIAGHALGIPLAAAQAAALLSERDIVDRSAAHSLSKGPQAIQCDVTNRVLALRTFRDRGSGTHFGPEIKAAAAQNVQRVAQQLLRLVTERLGACTEQRLEGQLQRALLLAFPDRLARRREPTSSRGVMVGGRGVKLDPQSAVSRAELFLCLDVDAGGSEATVRAASAVELEWLPEEYRQLRVERFFHPSTSAIVSRARDYFLDLMLAESPVETPLDEETARLLARVAAERFERLLPAKDKVLQAWLARVRWLARELPDAGLPTFETAEMVEPIAGWCYGMRRLEEVAQLPWKSLLESLLNNEQRRLLKEQAPESVQLPTGRNVLLQYEPGKPPVLAARIQEFFGWQQTPRLAGGRVPLLLHLLAPNNRVQQITDDLGSFWTNTYPTVRKELRGRYPKHAWPESPQQS